MTLNDPNCTIYTAEPRCSVGGLSLSSADRDNLVDTQDLNDHHVDAAQRLLCQAFSYVGGLTDVAVVRAQCKGVRCPPIFSLSNLIDAGWL